MFTHLTPPLSEILKAAIVCSLFMPSVLQSTWHMVGSKYVFVELMIINVIAYQDPILGFDPLFIPHHAGIMGLIIWLSKTTTGQLVFPEHLQ